MEFTGKSKAEFTNGSLLGYTWSKVGIAGIMAWTNLKCDCRLKGFEKEKKCFILKASFTLMQCCFHVLIVLFFSQVAVILLWSPHFLVVCFLMTTVLGAFSLWSLTSRRCDYCVSSFVFQTITALWLCKAERQETTCKNKTRNYRYIIWLIFIYF